MESARRLIRKIDQNSAVETQSVEAVSLDEYVQRHGMKKVDFVKIDVEGAEASVLEGFTNVLNRDKPLVLMKVHELDRFKENHPALRKLREQNYQVRSLGMRDWQEHGIAEPSRIRKWSQVSPGCPLPCSTRRVLYFKTCPMRRKLQGLGCSNEV